MAPCYVRLEGGKGRVGSMRSQLTHYIVETLRWNVSTVVSDESAPVLRKTSGNNFTIKLQQCMRSP
ncbi:hypothetical protein OGM63_27245 [Plectonema radiosum NIES-515]|uniref:Uncharacterized protein n=1 Tax=Plectonema radiosum NIES-515 TaxID=2986073 RepID=A0ABT3B710_9CYAN|nr:hypothetical protein [Plectonema radiosum]MCV3217161.1 hypothetical protein [Plectonema radiosum NIES-515]